MSSIFSLAIFIGICFGKEARYEGEEFYDCGYFRLYPERCHFRRHNYCERDSDDWDYEMCNKQRYCCAKPGSVDPGNCAAHLVPHYPKCDITTTSCIPSTGSSGPLRRLLSYPTGCVCTKTIDGHSFCAEDVGAYECKYLPQCKSTSECYEAGSGCVKCATCESKSHGVCFPKCDQTPSPTTDTPTTDTPTTDTPTTDTPTTDTPTTDTPTTDTPTTDTPTTDTPTTDTPTTDTPTTDTPTTDTPTTDTPTTDTPTTDTPTTDTPTTDTPTTDTPTTDTPTTDTPTTDTPTTDTPTTDTPTTDTPTTYEPHEVVYDCGMFRKWPGRCAYRRRHHCAKKTAYYDDYKCSQANYCCKDKYDVEKDGGYQEIA